MEDFHARIIGKASLRKLRVLMWWGNRENTG